MLEMMNLFGGAVILGLVFMLIIFILAILAFVFWILMLVDCVERKFKEEIEKVVWVLVIIFTGIIGALIYYFIIKVKDKKKKK
jgi:hypothetical protein